MEINAQKFQVDEERREITFSCCSEQPCTRYDEQHYIEYEQVLIIDENSVDLSRLNNGAPVLFNHDTDKLIGMVQKAWIADGKVFVKVRFSGNDEFAERIYKDILDGIIKNVSIGYQIEHYEDKKQDGIYRRYVDKFLIFQQSIVSVPADNSCGIRQLNNNQKRNVKMEENKDCGDELKEKEIEVDKEQATDEKQPEKQEIKDAEKDAEIDALKAENEALKAEMEQMKAEKEKQTVEEEKSLDEQTKEQIEKIGEDFEVPEQEIQRAIQDKLSVREFKNKIKSLNFNVKIKEQKNMNTKENFRDFIKSGNFEKPFTFRDFTGFGGGVGAGGTPLIGTDTQPLVQALTRKMGVSGFRTLSGLHFNVSIPVQTTRNVVYQTGLNEAATTSNPGFTAVTLSPVKISGNTVVGKDLLTQCNDDIVAFVVDSLQKEIAYKIEDYMLGKVVASNPTEINYSALSAIDWDDILAFEAALSTFDLGEPQYVMSAGARSALKGTPKVSAYPDFLCSADNYINGYKCNVSGCVGNDNIYFGDWDKLVLGIFGQGLETIINPYSYAKQGLVEIVASICIDSAVIQPEAFAIGKVQSESSSSAESSSGQE